MPVPKNKVLKVGVMSFRTELEELALIYSGTAISGTHVCPLLFSSVDMKALKAGSALCRVPGSAQPGKGRARAGSQVCGFRTHIEPL